ncbi:hypothetical protein PILCRDRAFT_570758 [Piloderma croceum F 1598]|uniref:Uncharacterized protein n=1 Tax=Piloderma croceum (strain F 1598) TaxID=765440 RepID=A0A0C3FHW7_PILCF|nr:hypothetical protein PILCRDRAFT_570758 [Piloderma croceum F 1598]
MLNRTRYIGINAGPCPAHIAVPSQWVATKQWDDSALYFGFLFCFVATGPAKVNLNPCDWYARSDMPSVVQRAESRGDEGRIVCRVGILRTKTAH